ncbi:MAG: hypothetical protein QF600_03715 [Verrucomicrobiota bacterium]|jgi:hypothetical protein|nr:hypothetical protein [Verrucomicrobiota bacterium]
MRASKICLGVFIGFIAGILGFIALGTVLASFSIPKPAEIYRYTPQKSLIGYFLMFYPIALMFFGSVAGGCLTVYLTRRKSKCFVSKHGAETAKELKAEQK